MSEESKSVTMPDESKFVLETRDLTVGYDLKPLINHVNITVEPGKIVTLIGPNGAGKSTILKTIAGHLQKVGGTVYL